MVKNGRELEGEVDALFRLPLAEFIGARKALAARLKQDGRGNESERVKLLAKPSVSAWTVNQLYWNHREAFDRLLATGQRFRKAQTSGKVADMREALDARRGALSHLADLATSLLHDADHNPTSDMIRRITTTLEAVSAYEELPDGSSPGRMTKDVDPPGFESLASFVAGPATTKRTETAKRQEASGVSSSVKSRAATKKTTISAARERRLEESRRANIAAAKVSLTNARKALADARAKAQSLEGTQKSTEAAAKKAEKHRREAEERFRKARAAAGDAADRARSVKAEVDEANKALTDARRTIEKATKELELLFRGE